MIDQFSEAPCMGIPVPNFKAEECARDLAGDIREILKKYEPYYDAALRGEQLSEKDQTEMNMLRGQIRSMMELRVICTETDAQFRVGDYVTVRTELLAKKREKLLSRAIRNLKQWLH